MWATTLDAATATVEIDGVHGTAVAHGYLFVGGVTPSPFVGALAKIDPSTGAVIGVIDFPNDTFHRTIQEIIFDVTRDKLYVIFLSTNATQGINVTEVNPDTLASTDVIHDTATALNQGSITSDGTYLYVVGTSAGNVSFARAYRFSDFGLDSSLTFTGQNSAHNIKYDGTKLYVTAASSPAWVARLSLAPGITQEDLQQLTSTDGNTITDDLAFTSNYFWVGLETAGSNGNCNISRILKTDLTSRTLIDTGISNSCYAVYYDGTSIYAVFNTMPGTLIKMDPTSLASTTYQFSRGLDASNEIQKYNDIFLFTFFTSPSLVSGSNSFEEGHGIQIQNVPSVSFRFRNRQIS
jgi:hypothetical protein